MSDSERHYMEREALAALDDDPVIPDTALRMAALPIAAKLLGTAMVPGDVVRVLNIADAFVAWMKTGAKPYTE